MFIQILPKTLTGIYLLIYESSTDQRVLYYVYLHTWPFAAFPPLFSPICLPLPILFLLLMSRILLRAPLLALAWAQIVGDFPRHVWGARDGLIYGGVYGVDDDVSSVMNSVD